LVHESSYPRSRERPSVIVIGDATDINAIRRRANFGNVIFLVKYCGMSAVINGAMEHQWR
jgi:hypothetical protein